MKKHKDHLNPNQNMAFSWSVLPPIEFSVIREHQTILLHFSKSKKNKMETLLIPNRFFSAL